MFESVAPVAFTKRRKLLLTELLTLSIGIHITCLAAAYAIEASKIVFPIVSPRLVRAYSLISIPEPPPPPPPPPAPRPQQFEPPPPIAQIVAPTIIPETIPQVPDAPAPVETPEPTTDTASAGAGDINGQAGGLPGGTGPAVAGPPPFPDDGRVHIELGKDLPLEVISQEFPPYPADAKKLQLEDQVIIRYTIGTNGRVIDIQILSHANFASFDKAVLDTVRAWRFRPMIKAGKPVEVTHDLGINFVLVRR